MANKKYREERIRAEKEKRFSAYCKKLNAYPKICVALSVIVFITFLVHWVGVYNTDI